MQSFLAYAESSNLSRTSTNFVGTHYEYTVLENLKRLGFAFVRTGRASDLGIDLQGIWHVPALLSELRVLVQCKVVKKTSPNYIRELEGAFSGMPAEWRTGDVVGLLAATQPATPGVIEALNKSRWPMGFLNVLQDGLINQFLWNQSARLRGLEGLGTVLRYLPLTEEEKKDPDAVVRTEIVLNWKGKVLQGLEPNPNLLDELIKPLSVSKAETEEPVEKPKKKRGRPKKVEGQDAR